MLNPSLPEGFDDLEPFIDWAIPTERGRYNKRLASQQAELEVLYQTVLGRLDDILGWLDARLLEEVEDSPLMLLALALAEVAPAVEWYHQPDVINALDADRLQIFQ